MVLLYFSGLRLKNTDAESNVKSAVLNYSLFESRFDKVGLYTKESMNYITSQSLEIISIIEDLASAICVLKHF
jgi:hypothetical protein